MNSLRFARQLNPLLSAFWHSGILAFWHSGILAFWHSGILAFWHSGILLANTTYCSIYL